MKKVVFTFLSFLALQGYVMGQACGTHGSSVCTPAGGVQGGGFQDPSTVDCAVKGTAYSYNIQFTMFTQFDFLGLQNVDSIEFLSITNLPCGLCWAVNQTDKRYAKEEDGCLSISGTTTDAAGQYKLRLTLRAWINGNSQYQDIPPSLVDQTGVGLYIRVKDNAGANCPNADTSANATNLVATTGGCPVGINETLSEVSNLTLMPNPMNSRATVMFNAEQQGEYTLRVTDVSGKEVYRTLVNAQPGQNSAVIERNNMAAGFYLMSLTNGKATATHRFTVSE